MNKTLLLILDGWGVAESGASNAISEAKPAFWNHLLTAYPNTTLSAKEASVGLSPGLLSNSEVGHITIGAGRIVSQTAFAIGVIQCLALIPGTSRSAATIIGALMLGTSRVVATEFSFFLAIPTMCAATAFTLLKNGFAITKPEFLILLVGFLTSFAVASAVITVFMKYIKRFFTGTC
jgi:hypothetical protein